MVRSTDMYYDTGDIAHLGWPSHEVLAQLMDGQVIARSRMWALVNGQTDTPVVITVPDLREVRAVLDIEFWTSPDTSIYHDMDKRVHGNVVGITVYQIAAGTTLIVEVIALGPP